MAGKDLKIGNLVWAKMKGYPLWPAKIAQPKDSPKSKKPQHYIYFFGTHDFAWILDDKIFPHSEERLANSKMYKKKSTTIQNAIEEIESDIQKSSEKPKLLTEDQIKKESLSEIDKDPLSDKINKKPLRDKIQKEPSNNKIKIVPLKVNIKKKPIKDKAKEVPLKVEVKKDIRDKIKEPSKDKTKKIVSPKNKTKKKSPLKRQVPKTIIGKNCPKKRSAVKKNEESVKDSAEYFNLLIASIFTVDGIALSDRKSPLKRQVPKTIIGNNCPKKNEESDEDSAECFKLMMASIFSKTGYPNVIPPYISGRDGLGIPSSMYSYSSTPPYYKNDDTFIKQENKKIGFLGLGMMGSELAKNLMYAGHTVMVWNRTKGRVCNDFLQKAGAERARYPSDVIQACDYTFCCVSGPKAAKKVVFSEGGVLEGLEKKQCSEKAYIELTTIDPKTSKKIYKAIVSKGCRYLEAPIVGSRKDAREGTLVVLAGGDRSLFTDCDNCFKSWVTHAFYLSSKVGTASKMNLILSNLTGISFAALGEAMALVNRCKLPVSLFLEILRVGRMSCPLLLNKAYAIYNNDHTVNNPIKHQEKDMELTVALGSNYQQPMPITVAAKEVFTRAKCHYPDNDVSALHLLC